MLNIPTLLVICFIASVSCQTLNGNSLDSYRRCYPVYNYLIDDWSVDARIAAQVTVLTSGATAFIANPTGSNEVCNYVASLVNENAISLVTAYLSAKVGATVTALLGDIDILVGNVGVALQAQLSATIAANSDPVSVCQNYKDLELTRLQILAKINATVAAEIALALQQDGAYAAQTITAFLALNAVKYAVPIANGALGKCACSDLITAGVLSDLLNDATNSAIILTAKARADVIADLETKRPCFLNNYTLDATLRTTVGVTLSDVSNDCDQKGRLAVALNAALQLHTIDDLKVALGSAETDDTRLACYRRFKDFFGITFVDTEVSALLGVTITDVPATASVGEYLAVTVNVQYAAGLSASAIAAVNAKLLVCVQGWIRSIALPLDVVLAATLSNGITCNILPAVDATAFVAVDVTSAAVATFETAINAAIQTSAYLTLPAYTSVVGVADANLGASISTCTSLVATAGATVTAEVNAKATLDAAAAVSAAAVNYGVLAGIGAAVSTQAFAIGTLEANINAAANLQLQARTAAIDQCHQSSCNLNVTASYLARTSAYLQLQIYNALQARLTLNNTCSLSIDFHQECTLDYVYNVSSTAGCEAHGQLLGKLVLLKRGLGTTTMCQQSHAALVASVNTQVNAAVAVCAKVTADINTYTQDQFKSTITESTLVAVWVSAEFTADVAACIQDISANIYASVAITVTAQGNGLYQHKADCTLPSTLSASAQASAQLDLAARLPLCISRCSGPGKPTYINSQPQPEQTKKRFGQIVLSTNVTNVGATQTAGYAADSSTGNGSMLTFSAIIFFATIALFFL